MGSFILNYYAKRPWDGGHLNMEVLTVAGRERYGINQALDLRGFLLGGSQPRPALRDEPEKGEPAIAFEIKRDDDALGEMSRTLRERDEFEKASRYQVRLLKWKGSVSIDFARSNTCADLLFLLLDQNFATETELQEFISALRSHRMPTYTQLYLLAKWEERMGNSDARDEFQSLLFEKMRSHPQSLEPDSDLFAGGGIALAGNGNYFFIYPGEEEGEISCRYAWQPRLDSGYSVEFDLNSGRLLSIDGKRVPKEEADKLLAAGIGGLFAVSNRLRCIGCLDGRRYETGQGKLVAGTGSAGLGGSAFQTKCS